MKPLHYIAVTLSFIWLTHGAPQPLRSVNLTTVTDLTTPEASSSPTLLPDSEEKYTSTLISFVDKEIYSTAVEGSSEIPLAREETDLGTLLVNSGEEEGLMISNEHDDPLRTTNTIENIDYVTTESAVTKLAGKEVSKSEVPISQYVPPLDPVKHMLMMADIKKIPKEPRIPDIITTRSSILTENTANNDATANLMEDSSESPDSMEKEVAESSVEEKLEPIQIRTTINNDVSTEVILNFDNLNSEKEESTKTSSDASTTEKILTTINPVEESTPNFTEEPSESEKTAALLKNSDEILNAEDNASEKYAELEGESETTEAVFSSTEEAIKTSDRLTEVEDLTDSPVLLKKEELIFEKAPDSETTTHKPASTTLNEIELKDNDANTTDERKDPISITTTTVIPETTFGSITTISSKSEKKNISLDDELEFRSVKIPYLNASKVSYVERRPTVTIDTDITEGTSPAVDRKEFTTANIFTTIAELFSSVSSTTESPEIATERETEHTPQENLETTVLPLSVNKEELSDVQADSGAVLTNDPSDMLKVQSIKSGLDSVPAGDTSTDVPFPETTIAEIQPEILLNDESEKLPEPQDDDQEIEEGKEESDPESSDETTEASFSTADDISKNDMPTTISTKSISESEPEVSDEIDVEKVSSEPEIESDPSVDGKPFDYLSNLKDRYVSGENRDMVAAVQFLHYHDKASSEQCFKLVDAHWNYATNLTEENKKKQLEQTLEYSLFHKEAWKNATSFAWKSFNDTLLRRWFKSLSVLGTAALPEDKLNEFNRLKAEMKNTYSTAKVCTYVTPENVKKGQIIREKDCGLTLEPDLQRILTKSRDYDELVHVWKSWRDAAGKPIREKYLRFVNLSNEAARMNGFSDTGDMWREAYESETFETDLEQLWEQLRPLYEHLHAYVRRRLIAQYGSDKIKEDGPIPAHLFGNMWAQSWVSLLDITQPFPGKPSVDVTPIMENKNMSAFEMFKISEEFFTSLGLKPMPEPFWKHSLIEKPKDREIICHASAWDFCNGRDYRIKQCTDITMEDLITVHHEMGHIQYFLQYARQPNVFREGANPGFHEAIGDVLALSVSTPKHLKSIGLLDEVADDPEGDLNFLLYTALDKVSFLPSGYLIDLWRWGLFSGDIKPEEMNSRWWELRLKYQGICPPVKRTDTDFDPGAKFHVPGNVPYIRYFVSFVIQFQFHKVLCDASGHNGPLYKCDIYRSKEAGQILSQVMELGSSEHWSEAMKIMTGGATNKMDAGPILEYFEPLMEYLKDQNKNETIGWKSEDATICP